MQRCIIPLHHLGGNCWLLRLLDLQVGRLVHLGALALVWAVALGIGGHSRFIYSHVCVRLFSLGVVRPGLIRLELLRRACQSRRPVLHGLGPQLIPLHPLHLREIFLRLGLQQLPLGLLILIIGLLPTQLQQMLLLPGAHLVLTNREGLLLVR